MPMSHILRPTSIDQLRRRAKELLRAYRAGEVKAVADFKEFHHAPPPAGAAQLSDAQLVMARRHDFPSWPRFKQGIELFNAICANDPAQVFALFEEHPHLETERVTGVNSNWGPPLTCAAQVNAAKVVTALLERGGQDLSSALDRAALKGRILMARELIRAGARMPPDIALGPCEALSGSGLKFLADLGVPLTDAHGDEKAPLAMTLETYSRNPPEKHACLEVFAGRMMLPDTPVMAFHRGRIDLLEQHLARDPQMIHRRYAYREIYPPELGCSEDETLGLHGTPLHGTTLLHMAVDFDELKIAGWLLKNGADVNARADIDSDGFGGHTPLFNLVMSQARRNDLQLDGRFARLLLNAGADVNARASIRKLHRFHDDDTLHEYRDVTPLQYGRAYHGREWVNEAAMKMIEERGGR